MFDFICEEMGKEPVTEAELRTVENALHISFTPILREFYTKYNRVTLKENSFHVDGDEFRVDYIIPVVYGKSCLEKVMGYRWRKFLPQSFVPLAKDEDGEFYFWDIGKGGVFYVAMGNIEHPVPVCGSVEAFFELLNKSCVEE